MTRSLACYGDDVAAVLPGSSIHTIRLPNDGALRSSESIDICLADSDVQRASASNLLNRMYSWRGYGTHHQLPSAPQSATFTACASGQVFATLTLTVDSEHGLAVDQTFAPEVQKFRDIPGTRLCELTKFAVDTSTSSRPLLAALFHVIFIYGSRKFHCSDLLIEVNPRHRRFYEAMLGFKSLGDARTNSAVNAPAHLLWLNVADIRRNIDRFAAGESGPGRSLYSDFFSEDEERGIYARLAAVQTDQLHWDASVTFPAPPQSSVPSAIAA